ncbi:MAG: hypothetical protein JWN80_1896 [Microbacteriaceae bacterium]|jgi:energy-coupling factor transporter transmembrane protein EcfT|nr:hypothetical protein [Microbacteriaceae bacterium]
MTTTPPPVAPTPASSPAPVGPKTNTLAIVALILGIVVPIGGIIVGPIALGQIKRTGEGGRGLAMAGLILGIVFTLLYIIIIIANVILFATAASLSTYSY